MIRNIRKQAILLSLLLLCTVAGQAKVLLHGPYLQEVTTDGATVAFATEHPHAFAWIEVRQQGSNEVSVYKQSKDGLYNANTDRFAIRATGLKAAAGYQYRVCVKPIVTFAPYKVTLGEQEATPWYTFQTVDPRQRTHSLIVVSDMHNHPDTLEKLLNLLDYRTAEHIIYNGDMIDYLQMADVSEKDGPEDVYTAFVDKSVEMFAKEKPFEMVRGNHETRGDWARHFSDYFPRVGGHIYSSYMWGNLEVILLDVGEDKNDGHAEYSGMVDFDAYRTQEAAWLRQLIGTKAHKQAKHRIVVSHYSAPDPESKGWAGNEDFQRKFQPLLRQAKIDLLVGGHLHPKQCIVMPENYKGAGNNYPAIIQGCYSGMRIDIDAQGHMRVRVIGTDGKMQYEHTY